MNSSEDKFHSFTDCTVININFIVFKDKLHFKPNFADLKKDKFYGFQGKLYFFEDKPHFFSDKIRFNTFKRTDITSLTQFCKTTSK